jgi:hypothetical protein
MSAVLMIQMCLTFANQPLCQTIEAVPFKTIDDCNTAAMMVTKHSGRGIIAMCVSTGRKA